MERLKLIQQIYQRLADLEQHREEFKTYPQTVDMCDLEMKALRIKLQEVMNQI